MPSSAPAMSATNPLNALDAIRQAGVIIASDTAEYDQIAQFHPQDATSNPSLVFAALQKPQYNHLIDDAIDFALKRLAYGTLDERTQLALDYVLVQVSIHILDSIPGRVSVSVDPRLAYNYDAIISKAHALVRLFEEGHIPRRRILVKIPATYPGILAARTLEQTPDGAGGRIHTNLTLVFGLVQAVACAQAGASVLSPFIGRVKDWWVAEEQQKEEGGSPSFKGDDTKRGSCSSNSSSSTSSEQPLSRHPGIVLVRQTRQAYRQYRHPGTQIMAAGFRTADEVIEVAKGGQGPHLVTLPPELLDALRSRRVVPPTAISDATAVVVAGGDHLGPERVYVVARQVGADEAGAGGQAEAQAEAAFYEDLQRERIAMDKVPEGLNKFSKDAAMMERLVRRRLQARVSSKKVWGWAVGSAGALLLTMWFVSEKWYSR